MASVDEVDLDDAKVQPGNVRPGVDQEHPASVTWAANALREWIKRLGTLWIDGQISQLSIRGDSAFMTLRDLSQECSLPVFATGNVLRQAGRLEQGDRVLINAGVEFWVKRGELRLRATHIRKVGIGEWLAELERLRTLLEAEGLFRPERKRALPFLPERVGLISGRNSDAERDVITHARNRWPTVHFEIRNTAVQGVKAVPEVIAALVDLDRNPDVDVIVIARGGGSVEDLLPFSNEALIRAVAAAGTPVVSAIGHERDSPILDLVADLRASTPTDAGKLIVPDIAEQGRLIRDLRQRNGRAVKALVRTEWDRVRTLRTRPVLADPTSAMIVRREQDVEQLQGRARRSLMASIDLDVSEVAHLRSRVRALSPAATLDRGYAVVQGPDGAVIRDPAQAPHGARLRVRVADGEFAAERLPEDGGPA